MPATARCRSCAARPNARAGMLGVFGPPGAYIPGSDMTLKVAAIRGVESRGMMCSSRELSSGTTIAGSSSCPRTRRWAPRTANYAGLDDPVFDVAITPNRQDAMGVRGIARDLAAAGIGTLKPLAVPQIEGSFPCPVASQDRGPGRLPGFLRPRDPGRQERPVARLDAAPAEGGRASARSPRWWTSPTTSCSTTAARRTPTTSPSSTASSRHAAARRREGARAQREGVHPRTVR